MAELHWLKRPIAHRGLHDASRGVVENSRSAVKAAMGRGYAIEVDLQCAAADMPVVFHDQRLDRLTHERGPVAAHDVATLERLRLRDGGGDTILSLPDLLDIVGGYVPLVLEVKSTWRQDGAFAANIAKQLAGYQGPIAVMSFDPHAVATFRREAPALPRGLVAGQFDGPEELRRLSSRQRFAMRHLFTTAFARPHFIAYDVRALPALAPLLARFVFGLPLLTWTVRTKAEKDRGLRFADAIIFEGITP